MKQLEKRMTTAIAIECEPTIKEKLRVLFSKKFVVRVDLEVDSSDGIVHSERSLLTLSN